MNQNVQRELQAQIEAFSQEIVAILTSAVTDSVASALAGKNAKGGAAMVKRGPGRPPKNPSFDTDSLPAEIKRNGDRRSEQLAKSLRTTTKKIAAPLRKLVELKKVKTQGKARGTKYSAT
jgi:predicted HTH transcriptional regulator